MRRSPLILLLLAACNPRPSDAQIEAAVREAARRKVPSALIPDRTLDGTVVQRLRNPGSHTTEVTEIRVLSVEKPERDTSSRPYATYCRARVYLSCTSTESGGAHRFAGEMSVYLFKKADGWGVAEPW